MTDPDPYAQIFRRRQIVILVIGIVLFVPGIVWLLAPGKSEAAVTASSTGLICLVIAVIGLSRGSRQSKAE